MVTSLTATTPEEIADALRSYERVRIVGSDSCCHWRRPGEAGATELRIGSGGILEHDVDDQVVVVSGGATLSEVWSGLGKKGQALPVGGTFFRLAHGTVGGQLSMNLPHGFQHACGSWRDWILGLTIVRPDGTIAKCGSKAVKNVAGYDVAKLFVGARGTLGVIAEVILRTYPLAAEPISDSFLNPNRTRGATSGYLQRVLPSDLEGARAAYGPRWHDEMPQIGVLSISGDEPPIRFTDDWVLGWGLGERNIEISDPTQRGLMERTKAVMDPSGKLNPGEFY